MSGRGRQSSGGRGGRNQFQRTDRVGELIREIVADELRRIDDDDLQYVTVTGVDVDRDLFRANVFLSTLDLDPADIEAIDKHSKRLRKAVARQARLRKTPELVFEIDPGLVSGQRVDALLAEREQLASAEEEEDSGNAIPAAWADYDPAADGPPAAGEEE